MSKTIRVGDKVNFLEITGEVMEIVKLINYEKGGFEKNYKVRFIIDNEKFYIMMSEKEINAK